MELGDTGLVGADRAARCVEVQDVRVRLAARGMLEGVVDEDAAFERDVLAAELAVDLDAPLAGRELLPCGRLLLGDASARRPGRRRHGCRDVAHAHD